MKMLNLKIDKWSKMIGQEENKIMIQEFFDKAEILYLLLLTNSAGQLSPTDIFPEGLRQKGEDLFLEICRKYIMAVSVIVLSIIFPHYSSVIVALTLCLWI